MTTNQLRFQELRHKKLNDAVVNRETQRSNLAKERENERSNKAREYENTRHNTTTENETYRHNSETEDENRRHNYESESIGRHQATSQRLKSYGSFFKDASRGLSDLSSIF